MFYICVQKIFDIKMFLIKYITFDLILELNEGWSEHTDPLKAGVLFYLKYMGSTLLEELGEGDTYGDGRSTEAIRTIINFVRKCSI